MNVVSGVNSFFQNITRSPFKLISLLFYVFFFLLVLTRIALVFCYSGEIGGLDNNFPYPVMRLLKGLSMYPAPQDYPFALNPYAPFLFYLSYAVCWVFGVGAGDTIQIYFATRGVCLLCDLTSIFLLYRIMRRFLHVSTSVAQMASLSFFYLISYWGYTTGRSDSLVLVCFAAIVFQLLRFTEKPSVGRAIFIGSLCTIAIFSKQSGIITAIAAIALLFYQRNWKGLLAFIFSFFVFFGGCMLLFTRLYGNGYFMDHLARALNNRLDPQWYYVNIFKAMVGNLAFIPLAVGTLFALRWLLLGRRDVITYLSFISLLVTSWSACIAIKWGSHLGYFHDSLFCFTCILAVGIDRISDQLLLRRVSLTISFILIFSFIHILLQSYFFHLNDYTNDKQHYKEQLEVSDELTSLVGKDEYIFAYTNHYKDFFKTMLQDKVVAPNLDIIDCCAYPDRNFDYSKFRDGFSNGKIRFVLFNPGEIHTTFQDISLSHYKFYKTINQYIVYQFEAK